MAMRRLKLSEMSQMIHLSRTASNSINMALTQMKAVRKSSSRMKVRGNAVTCNAAPRISRSREHPIAVVNPKSKSLWYSRSLSLCRKRSVKRSTCSDLSQSTDRALIACDRNRFTRFVGWWCAATEWRFRNGRLNLSATFDCDCARSPDDRMPCVWRGGERQTDREMGINVSAKLLLPPAAAAAWMHMCYVAKWLRGACRLSRVERTTGTS